MRVLVLAFLRPTAVAVVVVLATSACGPTIVPAPVSLSAADVACVRDSECVLVDIACGCSAGGSVAAVHVDAADAVEAGHRRVLCDAVISDDPTCGATPACVDDACALLAPPAP